MHVTTRRRPAAAAVLATALCLALQVVPAAAAPAGKGKQAESETTSAPASSSTSTPSVAPDVREELVDDLGSLHEVTGALGLHGAAAPTGAGVGVAIIDTGIVDVPALRHSNVVVGPDFSLDAMAEEAIGRDLNGHGTHLASLIASTDAAWAHGDRTRQPGRQIGVAPDATLVSVKVGAANGAVDVTQVIAAINWVVDHRDQHDIRVLSLSYGTDSKQDWRVDPLSHAVERAWHAGIAVVVAAGNEGNEASSFANPATNPWVIVAGAATPAVAGDWLDHRDWALAATYSSGTTDERVMVNAVAPGTSVVGARVPGSFSDQHNAQGRVGDDLVRASGSSQAAAIVAGAAAAVLEARPELTPDQLKQLLYFGGYHVESPHDAYAWSSFVRVDETLRAKVRDQYMTYHVPQQHERSTGAGSVDAARGTHRLSFDGEELRGEVDLFGNDFSAGAWADDAFAASDWHGLSWSSASWSGISWSGLSWSGLSWSGLSWSGMSWSGLSWSGLSWSGVSWSGISWSGLSWSGLSWSSATWR